VANAPDAGAIFEHAIPGSAAITHQAEGDKTQSWKTNLTDLTD
jgi:hypothetical protein